jgi:hypothetical protein
MIEGTRQYKGGDKSGNKTAAEPAAIVSSEETSKAPQASDPTSSDAVNLERREWFNSLLPAFGDGLVKILRASNNLQQELHSTLKAKTESFSEPDKKEKPGS